jgi:hypothetical protein
MPGAYAHITLVNILKEPGRLEAIPGFPEDAMTSVMDYFKFCELGAVSPDYPYLTLGDSGSARWADAMHYTRTGGMIRAGAERLQGMGGEPRRKCLAWLLGYAAHVATDVTIHPVIERKVGVYAENKERHRICEMNQDAYIFPRLKLGEVGLSEHLDSGILKCCEPANKHLMDNDIVALWTAMLKEVHPQEFASNPPDMHKWHKRFKIMLDDLGEEGNKLFPFARHVATGLGLTYPAVRDIDPQYLHGLELPGGAQKKDYDPIYESATANTARVWQSIAAGMTAGNAAPLAWIAAWNLDTGRDENNNLVFWS